VTSIALASTNNVVLPVMSEPTRVHEISGVVVAHLRLLHDPAHPSHVVLPVIR